eukprot:CAMPEP_0204190098 /NCGR_PEP_ID=MMETSP0361-20130328/59037_1 /ASSEMBLY_ACC=CAM_ASM_000343 /TAXON_ID=268821 /ORGANISM="Scrippsiella Hangoei, Strain SHTV-5" /LENGTH=234 /DNA_ID=CAMNT_0051150863 /DNA_START=48 /DNA_END=749 /DNA_ORIENTATION=-
MARLGAFAVAFAVVIAPAAAQANVALGRPVSTSLHNTYARDVGLMTNGVTTSGEWSSRSANGVITTDLQGTYMVTAVFVYWSGRWGAGTDSFQVRLLHGGQVFVAYNTTNAPFINDRTDKLDLVSLGSAGLASRVELACDHTSSSGFAVFDIQVFTRPYSEGLNGSNSECNTSSAENDCASSKDGRRSESNVALGKPVSTSLHNTYARDVGLMTNGVTTSGEWSSSSTNGVITI